MTELSMVSIVATGYIDAEFALDAVSDDIESYSTQYNPDKPTGLFVKLYEEGPTITIHRTGSFNIRGANSREELNRNKSLLTSRLLDLGMNISISEFKITNIVYTANLDMYLDLNELALQFGFEDVEYDPEQFPGMVYRVNSGVLLVFSSGKVVITGFTENKKAEKAYDELKSKLNNG